MRWFWHVFWHAWHLNWLKVTTINEIFKIFKKYFYAHMSFEKPDGWSEVLPYIANFIPLAMKGTMETATLEEWQKKIPKLRECLGPRGHGAMFRDDLEEIVAALVKQVILRSSQNGVCCTSDKGVEILLLII